MPYTTLVAGTTITASWANASVRDQTVTPFATAAARTSAVTVPVTGMLSHRADHLVFEGYDGSGWVTVPYQPFTIKTADENLTSNTTLQDDDELAIAVRASAWYGLNGMIRYAAGTTGDIKFGWSGPASAALQWAWSGVDTSLASTNTGELGIGDSSALGGAGSSFTQIARLTGFLQVAGTAGTLTFRWAQNTSDGTASSVKTGSWIQLTRMRL
jgi:hypothetical protein